MTNPQELADRWDAQQTAYVRHRADRFATMARVVAHICKDTAQPRILDLAGGFGSLGLKIIEQLPQASLVIADKDPVLLAIGTDLTKDRPEVEVVDVDLNDPNWHEAVGTEPFEAVVSSTALHWLRPENLTAVYWRLSELVRPGGIVLNGDNLYYDETTESTLHRIAADDDEAVQQAAFEAGVDTWDDWWKAAESFPAYAEAAELRSRRWGADLHTPPPKVTLGFHQETLRSAGFREVGTIWRYLDDHVVYAVR
ncbi:class I SAM-dependent methyltransferase [Kribbella antibiotica]|uniref:Class I SAM-dependent methyltransferase n=1 Tax=Kribbella antibiotica TaxID=190195 RepID=A0A4R4ZU99_9ACTN|nr:class I SAM-dependent methyltransferase [Kribbella antibiotica]TDD62728.1 class I SAM-dependent methyltransferase [Kribbella antibiotica]